MSEPAEPLIDASAGLPAAIAVAAVGARLKVARESAGLSVADVAQRLKYSPKQVQALEDNKTESLPSLTFQRGFVRGYAKLLGLDANLLVASLESQRSFDHGPTTLQLQQVAYAPSTMPEVANHNAAWPWILCMLIVVVAIGGYALYDWQAPSQITQTTTSVSAPVASTERSVAVTTSMVNPISEERSIPLPQPLAEVVPPASAPTSGRLRLMFGGDSWTEVRQANGEVVYSGIGSQGMERWADGQPPFDLIIGNAKQVKLFYRGAEVDLTPYIKVSVARLQLK